MLKADYNLTSPKGCWLAELLSYSFLSSLTKAAGIINMAKVVNNSELVIRTMPFFNPAIFRGKLETTRYVLTITGVTDGEDHNYL